MMIKTKIFTLVFGLLILSGCVYAPPASELPELSYANIQPLSLDVGSIEIVNQVFLGVNNAQPFMAQSPSAALTSMLQNRLKAVGQNRDRLLVTIEEAAITQKFLPKEEGFRDIFFNDPDTGLVGVMKVRVDLKPAIQSQHQGAFVQVSANRSGTILESATAADRERVYLELTENLIRDIQTGLDESLAARMPSILP
jgi:hypothetical protein